MKVIIGIMFSWYLAGSSLAQVEPTDTPKTITVEADGGISFSPSSNVIDYGAPVTINGAFWTFHCSKGGVKILLDRILKTKDGETKAFVELRSLVATGQSRLVFQKDDNLIRTIEAPFMAWIEQKKVFRAAGKDVVLLLDGNAYRSVDMASVVTMTPDGHVEKSGNWKKVDR